MNLDKLLPPAQFTTTELNIIAENFTHPTVVKYLKDQQAACIRAIANGLPKEGQSETEYLRAQAQVIGGLSLLEAFLAIQPADPSFRQSQL